MPAARSWFKVHARLVLDQASLSLVKLSDPDNTIALLDLGIVGMDGTAARHALQGEVALLSDRLVAQEEATRWADESRAEVRALAESSFAWRQRLIARLRYAATCGADPDRSFPTEFGYRRLPRARARGMLVELPRLFASLHRHEATLRPHGIHSDFVAEGRLHHERLRAAQADVDEALAVRKDATQQVRRSHGTVRDLLLQLSAADEAAALEVGREPSFSLDLLASHHAAQRARSSVVDQSTRASSSRGTTSSDEPAV